jgi:Putative MetA-pathway of phenol degradation
MKKTILTIFLLICSCATNAEEGKFGLTTGLDYSTGKYGQSEATRIKYIPFTGKYEYDRWLVKVTVPWLEIDGSSGATGGESKVILERNTNKHTRESGLGDIVSSVTYTALESSEYKFILDAGAKVKFGTASVSKGLGSGENDYAFQLDAYKTLEKLTLMGTVGYRVIGNPGNSDYSLQNVWFGSVGAAYKIDAKNSAGLFVDLREAAWEYNTNIREYTVYYSHRFNPTYNLQSYITTGDTTSSVDFGGGIMLGVTW